MPSTRIVNFWMNSTQPPLSDKRVRQALQYAVDVNAIIKNIYAGQGKPIAAGVADMDFGHNPAIKPYPYDPAQGQASSSPRRALRPASTSRSTRAPAPWSTTRRCSR